MMMMTRMICLNSPKGPELFHKMNADEAAVWFWLKRTLFTTLCGVLQTPPAAHKDQRE